MDRFTYEKLRASRPELVFPPWHRLRRTDRHRAKRMNPEQLSARRTAVLLARPSGWEEPLQTISSRSFAAMVRRGIPTGVLDTPFQS